MDQMDRKLIGILQKDGRISVTDLADELPLSISATRERMRRLERIGVIEGFTVLINPAAVGRTIEALIEVRLGEYDTVVTVDEQLRSLESVVNAHHLSGRFDTQLHVTVRDVAELNRLLNRIKEELGAEETNTRLILRTIEGFPRPAVF